MIDTGVAFDAAPCLAAALSKPGGAPSGRRRSDGELVSPGWGSDGSTLVNAIMGWRGAAL
jgi:hypothetical protein